MKPIIYAAIAASLLAVHAVSFAEGVNGSNGAAAGSSSTATSGSSTGHSYAVFVDQPTGFTFVKLPSGWKFVGAVTHEDTAHLPPGVLTAVLPRNNEPRTLSVAGERLRGNVRHIPTHQRGTGRPADMAE